jgi:ATP-dependent Clp protease ATP-binding subunit ClpA
MAASNMDRFTPNARRAVAIAEYEARRLHHQFVETEHLLKGLMRDESSSAARVLRDLGLQLSTLETALKERAVPGLAEKAPQPELHADVKITVALALQEAKRLGHAYIGTEHLLLGLTVQSNESSVAVLKRFDLDPELIRKRTTRIIEEALVRPKHFGAGVEVNEKTGEYLAERVTKVSRRFHDQIFSYREKELAAELHELLAIAQIQAERLGSNSIRSEHLLLAMLLDEHNYPAKLLRAAGINPRETVEKITERLASLEELVAELELSPEMIEVLGLATVETRNSIYNYPLGEHLLLGLLLQKENTAIDILRQQNIDLAALEKATRESLQ